MSFRMTRPQLVILFALTTVLSTSIVSQVYHHSDNGACGHCVMIESGWDMDSGSGMLYLED
eukprot:447071-Rhodomonas_salina.1